MNLYICGIIDIILILMLIIFLVVGFKVGFMKKALSLVSFIMVLAFGFLFCGQLSEFFKNVGFIYPSIFDKINGNVLANLADKGIDTNANLVEVISAGMGLPEWFAGLIENAIVNSGAQLDTVSQMVNGICDFIATIILKVICFGIIVVGILLATVILKALAELLRKSSLISAIDGIFGAIYYLVAYLVVISVLFFILSILMRQSWFTPKDFFIVDMQLDTDKFRLSKFVYEGNVLKNIIDLFF